MTKNRLFALGGFMNMYHHFRLKSHVESTQSRGGLSPPRPRPHAVTVDHRGKQFFSFAPYMNNSTGVKIQAYLHAEVQF